MTFKYYFLKKIFKEHEKFIFPEIEIKLRSSKDVGLNRLENRNEPDKKQLFSESSIQSPNISELFNECENSDNTYKDDSHSILFQTDLTLKFFFFIIII